MPDTSPSNVRGNSPAGEISRPWIFRGRVPGLDGLRAVSILLVLVAHASEAPGFPWSMAMVKSFDLGTLGVQIFFVISGFLITLLLLRELEATGGISLRQFYLRRVLRLLPVYAAFLIGLVVLQRMQFATLNRTDWLLLLTGTVNLTYQRHEIIAHIWSLSMEEQFYLAWPPLLLRLGSRRARTVLLGYLAVAPVLRILVRLAAPHQKALVYTSPLHMEGMAIGCLLALLAMEPWFRDRTALRARTAALAGAVSMVVLLASRWLTFHSNWFSMLVGTPLTAAAAAALIWLGATYHQSLASRVLQSRPLVALGVLSYSIYLWQQLFFQVRAPAVVHWPVNVIGALLAGALSYTIIESPFLRVKQRLQRKSEEKNL